MKMWLMKFTGPRKLRGMKCFRCIVAWQARERETINPAVTMYSGMALCLHHVNSVRGLKPGFTRYPAGNPSD